MWQVPYFTEKGMSAFVRVEDALKTPRAITPPVVTKEGAQWWRGGADFLWWDGAHLLRFRRGFGWNGMSMPWFTRWYAKPGDYLSASLPHDFGYTYHWMEVWDPSAELWRFVIVTKGYVDDLFEQILFYHYNVSRERSGILYGAVAAFGWVAWLTGVCDRSCKTCPESNAADCPYRNNAPVNEEFIGNTLTKVPQ